jgi:hypothetical protein
VTALLVLPLLGAVFGLMVGYLTVMRTQNAMDDRLDRIEQFFLYARTAGSCSARAACTSAQRGKRSRHRRAWASPKAGYGFYAQALGTRKEPASHKPTASAAGRIEVCRKPDFSAMPEGIIFRSDLCSEIP